MKPLEKGMLARSKAGHDKDSVFVVVDADDRYVYLADGDGRTAAAPKKKSRRHVQPITKTVLTGEDGWSNEQVKRIINLFVKEDLNV